MKKKTVALIVLWYALVLSLSLVACLNLGNTASTCMDACGDLTKACLADANTCMAGAMNPPAEHACLYEAEQCMTSALACVTACVKKVEAKLN